MSAPLFCCFCYVFFFFQNVFVFYFLPGNPTVNLDSRFVDLTTLNFLDMSSMASNTVQVINADVTLGAELILNVDINNPTVCDSVSIKYFDSFLICCS